MNQDTAQKLNKVFDAYMAGCQAALTGEQPQNIPSGKIPDIDDQTLNDAMAGFRKGITKGIEMGQKISLEEDPGEQISP